jgi:hypothetical protein
MCKCADTVKPKKSNGVSTQAFAAQSVPDEPMIRVQYQGGGDAKVSVYGTATRQSYGRRKHGETFLVFERDAQAQPGLFKPI